MVWGEDLNVDMFHIHFNPAVRLAVEFFVLVKMGKFGQDN